jgi:hypothetical protein
LLAEIPILSIAIFNLVAPISMLSTELRASAARTKHVIDFTLPSLLILQLRSGNSKFNAQGTDRKTSLDNSFFIKYGSIQLKTAIVY